MKAGVIRDIYHSFSFMLDEVEITEVTPEGIVVTFKLKNRSFRTIFKGEGVSYTSEVNGKEEPMCYKFNHGPKFIWEMMNYFNL